MALKIKGHMMVDASRECARSKARQSDPRLRPSQTSAAT